MDLGHLQNIFPFSSPCRQFHTLMILKSGLMGSSHRSLGRPLGLCLKNLYVGPVESKWQINLYITYEGVPHLGNGPREKAFGPNGHKKHRPYTNRP
ncbi:hypothetical protein TNCV_5029051 [Trichonephila clavipes]|nr:hypothetical protein TNCV_5029051 [Trichonephila clavipes]